MTNEWTEHKTCEHSGADCLLDLIVKHKIVHLSNSVDSASIYHMPNNRIAPFWIKLTSHIAKPVEYNDLLEISVVYTHQTIEIEGE